MYDFTDEQTTNATAKTFGKLSRYLGDSDRLQQLHNTDCQKEANNSFELYQCGNEL